MRKSRCRTQTFYVRKCNGGVYFAGRVPFPRTVRPRADFQKVVKPKLSAKERARRQLRKAIAEGHNPLVGNEEFTLDERALRAIRKRKCRKRTRELKQNPDAPFPIPRGDKRRGGKQTAEELKNPPYRTMPNGGQLRTGGTNKGGHGATPSELRSRIRSALALADIFDVPMTVIRDPDATHNEKMNAWAKLCQYGGLASVSLTDNDGNPLELPPFVVQMVAKTNALKPKSKGTDGVD